MTNETVPVVQGDLEAIARCVDNALLSFVEANDLVWSRPGGPSNMGLLTAQAIANTALEDRDARYRLSVIEECAGVVEADPIAAGHVRKRIAAAIRALATEGKAAG